MGLEEAEDRGCASWVAGLWRGGDKEVWCPAAGCGGGGDSIDGRLLRGATFSVGMAGGAGRGGASGQLRARWR